MATAAPSNNPAGEPPANDTLSGPSEAEIMDVFDLGDTTSLADAIAAKQPPAAPVAEPGAGGESSAAPASPPDTTPKPGSEAPAPSAAPEPAQTPASAAPAAPSPALETPAAAPTPQLDERALREASLAAQVDALQRQVQELQANPQSGQPAPAGQPPSAESGQQGQPVAPLRYNLTLPEPVKAALLSDNPQENAAAITAIVNDLGTIVHHAVVTQMRTEMKTALDSMVQQATAYQATGERSQATEDAKKDYYKAFPGHDNPLVLPIIQAETRKMAAEFPGLPWGEQYINALGVRVDNYIAALNGGAQQPTGEQPAPAPNGGGTPPAKPAAHLPSGPRSGSAVLPSGDLADEITSVLSPFE